MIRRHRGLLLFIAVGAAAGAFWRSLGPAGREGARRQARREAGRLRGRAKGWVYRMRGGRPDEDVLDTVLADRIRSTLGPLEKRLDLPHVHVMSVNHHVMLHGCVSSEADVARLEEAVLAVPGVRSVTSELHVGLGPGDERPSAGRRHAVALHLPSPGLRRLTDAAAAAGGVDPAASPLWARSSVGAVLSTLCSLLPHGERDHLLLHLPADVRDLVAPSSHRRIKGADEFITAAQRADAMPDGRAPDIVRAVLAVVRELAPEEAHDVSSVLPTEVAELWWSVSPA